MKNQFGQYSLYLLTVLFLFFVFQLFFLAGFLTKAQPSPQLGLVYSLVSFAIYLLGSILAILLGTKGLLAARRDPSLGGKEWSIAGIVLGSLVLLPILVGFFVVFFTGVN